MEKGRAKFLIRHSLDIFITEVVFITARNAHVHVNIHIDVYEL